MWYFKETAWLKTESGHTFFIFLSSLLWNWCLDANLDVISQALFQLVSRFILRQMGRINPDALWFDNLKPYWSLICTVILSWISDTLGELLSHCRNFAGGYQHTSLSWLSKVWLFCRMTSWRATILGQCSRGTSLAHCGPLCTSTLQV